MKTRYLVAAFVTALVAAACGDATGDAGGSGGTAGAGGTVGVGGIGGSRDDVGGSCGAPLSAPAAYDTEGELEALMLGAWELCDSPGLFTPEAVGIELRADRTWVELFEVDGEIVRSREVRQWIFFQDEQDQLTLALISDRGGMSLYRPKFYTDEGQMQIEHIGDDRRLRTIS